MTTPPPMRASDEDRAATVHRLQDAVTRGLLTPDEGSERMAAAWAAVHERDLPPLTADLPPAPSTSARTAPGWGGLASMAVEQVRTSVREVRTGRISPARVAVAIAVVLLFVGLIGSLVGELLFDGPHMHGDFGDFGDR